MIPRRCLTSSCSASLRRRLLNHRSSAQRSRLPISCLRSLSSSESHSTHRRRQPHVSYSSFASIAAAGAVALCTCLHFGGENSTLGRPAYAHTATGALSHSDARTPSSLTARTKTEDDDRFGSLHGGALPEDFKAGDRIPGLHEFTRDEVAHHIHDETGIWVTYRDGVYDITDFIDAHPGGESKIKLAKGGAIDPFWDLYSIHKSPHVWKTIEQFRIGNLAVGESQTTPKALDDPYRDEPARHPALRVRSERPFNAETPLELIGDNFLVPAELFYVRNHLPTPNVDIANYKLQIALSPKSSAEKSSGEVDDDEFTSPFPPIELSVADLKSKFKHLTVTTTMLCGGNRRSELSKVNACPGLPWGAGAISTATWTGVRLRDLLRYCGVEGPTANAQHVCFEGLDDPDVRSSFGSSVEVDYALEHGNDVLIAWEMNGEPLTRDHGYPLRVIIPGVIGARNVKWLRRIYLSPTESPSLWQVGPAYRVFPGTTRDPSMGNCRGQAVYDPPVQSVFTQPVQSIDGVLEAHDIDSGRPLLASGYAFSGGGRSISYVEVSPDNGKTWIEATLLPKPHFVNEARGRCWTWTLWRCQVDIPEAVKTKCREAARKASGDGGGKPEEVFLELAVRARDSGNNLQPAEAEHAWNYRGLLCNSWGRVRVPLRCDEEDDDDEEDV